MTEVTNTGTNTYTPIPSPDVTSTPTRDSFPDNTSTSDLDDMIIAEFKVEVTCSKDDIPYLDDEINKFVENTNKFILCHAQRNEILRNENKLRKDEEKLNELNSELEKHQSLQRSLDLFTSRNRPEKYSLDTWKRLSTKNRLTAIKCHCKRHSYGMVLRRRVIRERKREFKRVTKQFIRDEFETPLKNLKK